MSAKRIFVLNGHPAKHSLSRSIAEAYAEAAKGAGHDVRLTHIHDMEFDSDFGAAGYQAVKPLEPHLLAFQEDLEWAQHIVMTTPMWWGGLPAKLKGLFDRTLLPGWAFDTHNVKMGLPAPLLAGRTARVFLTSDTPDFFFGLVYRKALLHQIKKQIFAFVGIKPTKFVHFSAATKAGPEKVAPWLKTAAKLGAQGI